MRHLYYILVTSTILSVANLTTARAADSGDLIKEKVMAFYGNLSSSDYREALSQLAVGSRGYTEFGLLKEIPTPAVLEAVIQSYGKFKADGGALELMPRNIDVSTHGSIAIATFYVDGSVKAPDRPRRGVVERGTLVWEHKDDQWKIVHWHISELHADSQD